MSRAQNIHVLLVAIPGRHDAVHCNRCGDAAMAGWLIQLLLLPTFLGDPPSWSKKKPGCFQPGHRSDVGREGDIAC